MAFVEDKDDAFILQRFQQFFERGLAAFRPLLVAFAPFIQCEAEFLDRRDDDLVGVVFRKQTAHEGGSVGVFLDTAFLKAVELFPCLAVEVFAVHDEDAFVDAVILFEQRGSLEGGQRLAAAVVCQMYPLPLSSSMHFTICCTADQLRTLDREIVDRFPKAIVLPLTDEAKERFIRFLNSHGVETLSHDDALAAAWSKLEGYALRLALVHHLTRWASGDASCAADGPVGIESIEAGIEVSRCTSVTKRRSNCHHQPGDSCRGRR